MNFNRLKDLGWIPAAVGFSFMLVGCGGSNSVSGQSPSIVTTGGLSSAAGTAPATAASTAPQQVQVTVNGATVTGTLPPNETITAGESLAVVSPGIPILNGLQYAPSVKGKAGAPGVAHGAQGEIDVDGCDTGITVDSGGNLSGYLILTPGQHTIHATGPFAIIGGSAFHPTQLTVGAFNFIVTINPDGIGSIPSALSLNLPINGGSLKNGHFVKVTYPTPDFATGTGTLYLKWTGQTIAQIKTFINGKATYKALSNNTPVPSTGLTSVEFYYSAQ